jgi:hypothetical protein
LSLIFGNFAANFLEMESLEERVFKVETDAEFENLALEIFEFQRVNNPVYKKYLEFLPKWRASGIDSLEKIPFMPAEFFKLFNVMTTDFVPDAVFTSSGTTGMNTSRHFVKKLDIYYKALASGFEKFYGGIGNYKILALLPSYLERKGSSLVMMVEKLMELSGNGNDGFYLYDFEGLDKKIEEVLKTSDKKILLIGVTFALLDYAEKYRKNYGERLIIMETGGMKGRRKELVREEVHKILCERLGVRSVHSEYGMTELLSQAYSSGRGVYRETNTMRIIIRDPLNPFEKVRENQTGGVNVVDLANLYSCSFIQTQDLGVRLSDGGFEVRGRFDSSDVRGCNLMYVR